MTEEQNEALFFEIVEAIQYKYSQLEEIEEDYEFSVKNSKMFKRLYMKHNDKVIANTKMIQSIKNDINTLNMVKHELMYGDNEEDITFDPRETLTHDDIIRVIDIMLPNRK